jgi:Protein of unknown function (DUF1161)
MGASLVRALRLVVHNAEAMRLYPLPKAIALAALLQALPSLAVTCEDLRAQIESKIRSTGAAEFTVSIVDAGVSAPGKIVGSCDRGGKKLVYTQVGPPADGTNAPAEAKSAPNRAAKKAAPILTECKDGSVSMNSDCKK